MNSLKAVLIARHVSGIIFDIEDLGMNSFFPPTSRCAKIDQEDANEWHVGKWHLPKCLILAYISGFSFSQSAASASKWHLRHFLWVFFQFLIIY